MAGIYIHIPFCKQACHYCNFHFSTSLTRKNELVGGLLKEIELRKPEDVNSDRYRENNYLSDEKIETIYFGGGTPSLLQIEDCRLIIEKIKNEFSIYADAEITLEANPDDINEENLSGWKEIGINRLSIGVQSFFEEDLRWMNRAHNASQAVECIELSLKKGFHNISVDLIYGMPLLTNEKWKQNVDKSVSFKIPHLSCYALTVEPKTPLQKFIQLGKVQDVNQDTQAFQFLLLMKWMEEAGYEHYEISNFAMPGYRSRHNSSYWQGKKYLGIGPSAHSFNGYSRQWNVSNNSIYIDSVNNNILPFEIETLTPMQQMNEYIMTSLRTAEGLNLNYIENKWGKDATAVIRKEGKRFINAGKIESENNMLKLTKEGKLLADGIASEFFFT
jgi:putative oxygen-independent coproporphyrinogen III oxidase